MVTPGVSPTSSEACDFGKRIAEYTQAYNKATASVTTGSLGSFCFSCLQGGGAKRGRPQARAEKEAFLALLLKPPGQEGAAQHGQDSAHSDAEDMAGLGVVPGNDESGGLARVVGNGEDIADAVFVVFLRGDFALRRAEPTIGIRILHNGGIGNHLPLAAPAAFTAQPRFDAGE